MDKFQVLEFEDSNPSPSLPHSFFLQILNCQGMLSFPVDNSNVDSKGKAHSFLTKASFLLFHSSFLSLFSNLDQNGCLRNLCVQLSNSLNRKNN